MPKPPRVRRETVPPDLREPVDAFLAHQSLERGAAKLTTEAYESDLVRFAAHCGRAGRTNWTEVSLADVDSWTRALDRKGHAAASLALRHSAVRSFSAYLVRGGLRRDDFT